MLLDLLFLGSWLQEPPWTLEAKRARYLSGALEGRVVINIWILLFKDIFVVVVGNVSGTQGNNPNTEE